MDVFDNLLEKDMERKKFNVIQRKLEHIKYSVTAIYSKFSMFMKRRCLNNKTSSIGSPGTSI